MDSAWHAKLEELFDAALDMNPDERAGYLEHACSDDESLREQVLCLLAADNQDADQDAGPLLGVLVMPDQARPHEPAEPPEPPPDGADIAVAPTLRHGPQASEAAVQAGLAHRLPVHAGALPAPGEHIRQYEIIRELGRGGMGAVFLARDTKLARLVAIKFLSNTGRRVDPRFLAEARATARCTHENIIVIHEVDEYRGTPFMVLEYVEGQSLRQWRGHGRVPYERAVELMVPVVRALAHAHEQGIVHRDLKPDNIIVTQAGAIKVLDFGIAKLQQDSVTGKSAADPDGAQIAAPDPDGVLSSVRDLSNMPAGASTHPGALLGTLPYMSPEQWQGARHVDHQTDIWAVGIMLYEMVAGHHPLQPENGEDLVVTRDLAVPMPDIRAGAGDLPEPLCRLIDRCLHKRKEQRISGARELLAGLEALLPARLGRPLHHDESPYPGLLCFRESDAGRFLGRSREQANMLERVRERALTGVTGPTGIGKSSFVRAGVIAGLRGSGLPWESYILRPGRDPFAALAALFAPLITNASASQGPDAGDEQRALARRLRAEPGYLGALLRRRARQNATSILLVVDPFEELYTLSPDAGDRHAFTLSLAGAADDPGTPVRVLISIRSDFLDRVAENGLLMNQLMAGLLFLTPPARDSLREALTEPCSMAGYRFESGAMVDRIVDEVAGTTGALPLLQFAAAELWQGRDRARRLITEARYREIGGIVGALARHADEVVGALAHLSPRAPTLVRALFRRLVTRERTRAIVPIEDLRQLSDTPDEVQAILDRLVDARLLLVHSGEANAGATVELIHDSLIHSWPQLGRWLDESQEDAAFLEQLATAAKQWQAKGRPQGLLWRGEAMDEARHWHRRYRGPLSPLERSYLGATFALADRAQRLKRLLIAGTMALLALLFAAATVALVLIRDAEREAKQQADAARTVTHELETQLDLLHREKRERQQAETRADDFSTRARVTGEALDRTVEELRESVRALEAAKARAENESEISRRRKREAEAARARAEEESERTRAAAEQARQANQALSSKLEEEQRRLQELERKAGKINRTLK